MFYRIKLHEQVVFYCKHQPTKSKRSQLYAIVGICKSNSISTHALDQFNVRDLKRKHALLLTAVEHGTCID